MKRIILSVLGILLCFTQSLAQREGLLTPSYSDETSRSLAKPSFSEVSLLDQWNALPIHLLPGCIPFFSYRSTSLINYEMSDSFQWKRLYLKPYSMRMINRGVVDINNMGMSLLWKNSPNTSLEWNTFLSQQYGYTLNSVHTGLGMKLNLNYHFNTQLNLSIWGQYLLNRNNDPFVRAIDVEPKNGIGLRLEYTPNANTKYSIDISQQEDFTHSKKTAVQVEGKAGFKF